MTTNPLNQRLYAVNAVVTDIGWITDQEQRGVIEVLDGRDDAVVHFTADLQQLRLYWSLLADGMNEALTTAEATLRNATETTGVPCPHVRAFHVDEMSH